MPRRATTDYENKTKQHGALTLVKIELLLSPGGYTSAKQNNYLQHHQKQQLANINVQAVSWGINLLNRYYPGLGQVIFQPVRQLLATTPIAAAQIQHLNQNQTVLSKFQQ